MQRLKYSFYILVAVVILNACKPAGGEFAGSEYMPDMAHSIAYEANVYISYGLNTWDSASVLSLKELSNPKLPVEGTVARGFAGVALDAEHASETMDMLSGKDAVNTMNITPNGSAPYYYDDTEEERTRAMAEIIAYPYPITAEGLARGEELYNTFCGICHGEKGDGLGYLYDNEKNPNAKYIAAPANFLLEDHINSSNGRIYHAIMYGKNVMGAYKDKISYEERWQVIHFIRSLQAESVDLEYSEKRNTFKPEAGTPISEVEVLAEAEETHDAGEHQEDEEHGEDHSTGGGHSSTGGH